MSQLVFATNNVGKFEEMSAVLGIPLERADTHIFEIQSLDAVEVVRHKAREAYKIIQKPLIVDDTSLNVAAWNGFPGPFIKHIIDAGGMELLLTMMRSAEDRSAEFSTTLGYFDGKEFAFVIGITKGKISEIAKGKKSWGINEIFIPDGFTKTYGEMTVDEKNLVSHR
ncbi:non-canonical purine NTP pyrophosphatase, partial [Candidatus Woesebacteria bacterium]|nr:non-canonical purine NTP pyrophosphatase [Candidatus Woesebacteria bacterium]